MSKVFAQVEVKPIVQTVLFWSGIDGNVCRPMAFVDVLARQNDVAAGTGRSVR